MTDVEEVSLRPLALRPLATAAGNPFAAFGKGAGFGIKANKVSSGAQPDDARHRRASREQQLTDVLLPAVADRLCCRCRCR